MQHWKLLHIPGCAPHCVTAIICILLYSFIHAECTGWYHLMWYLGLLKNASFAKDACCACRTEEYLYFQWVHIWVVSIFCELFVPNQMFHYSIDIDISICSPLPVVREWWIVFSFPSVVQSVAIHCFVIALLLLNVHSMIKHMVEQYWWFRILVTDSIGDWSGYWNQVRFS